MPFIRRTNRSSGIDETTDLFIKNPEKNMAQVIYCIQDNTCGRSGCIAKALSHRYRFEIMQLNGLFTTLFARISHFKGSD